MLVPLVELVVVFQVAAWLGGWPTVALLLATSILGVVLLARQSRRAWRELREAFGEGHWPGDELARGAIVVAGCVLLVIPGFVTAGLGLLCLLPPAQTVLSRILRAGLGARTVPAAGVPGLARGLRGGGGRRRTGRSGGQAATGGRTADRSGQVLDVEVVDVRRESPPDA